MSESRVKAKNGLGAVAAVDKTDWQSIIKGRTTWAPTK
jgi:hypothetical protein